MIFSRRPKSGIFLRMHPSGVVSVGSAASWHSALIRCHSGAGLIFFGDSWGKMPHERPGAGSPQLRCTWVHDFSGGRGVAFWIRADRAGSALPLGVRLRGALPGYPSGSSRKRFGRSRAPCMMRSMRNFSRLKSKPISKRFRSSATVTRSRDGMLASSPGSTRYSALGRRLP